MSQRATPIAFVQAILFAYEKCHIHPATALEVAQIAPHLLDNPNPLTAKVTAAQFEALSYHAMRELDDEALGWFTRRLPWGSYGMLARASISAPNLGVALKRWCRHHGLIADDITLTLSVQGEVATLHITENRDLATLREFCLVSVLRNVHGLACWFINSRIPLIQAEFPFDAPVHESAYSILFSAATRFQQAQAAIKFDARYLNLPLCRDETSLSKMLQHALPLTVRPYRRDRLLVERVRQALRNHPAQTHNADDLAALLHTSARTLHRQLKEEGASLQALKNQVRHQRATELLTRTNRPIKQIAQEVGFQNEKSFRRALKGWEGK